MRCVACQGKQPSAVFVDRLALVAAAVISGQRPPRTHPMLCVGLRQQLYSCRNSPSLLQGPSNHQTTCGRNYDHWAAREDS
jgi:hypothetical protein